MSDDRTREKMDEAHREGQKDGSEGAGFLKEVNTSTFYRLFEGEAVAEAYNAGLENGRDNKPED